MNPIEPEVVQQLMRSSREVEAYRAEVDQRLREGLERYRRDPFFHAQVNSIAQLFELRKAPELEEFDGDVRHEIMLGMALQAVVAMEMFDQAHPREDRLCGQQHPMIDGGSPCIARGSHATHTTASGKSWQSR